MVLGAKRLAGMMAKAAVMAVVVREMAMMTGVGGEAEVDVAVDWGRVEVVAVKAVAVMAEVGKAEGETVEVAWVVEA